MRLLEGVRVVDLTHALAGPLCTYHLGLLGADVIKVEPPGTGDDFRERPAVFAALNAGKRSVVLDLRTESGLASLRRLVAGSDVLVENYRPGVTDRLGIAWPSMREVNSRLIYCSISGYGQDGPLRDYPAIEWAVQAMSGMAHGYIDDTMDPAYLGLGVLDAFSGYLAFSGILAALLQRQRSDVGQFIDVAMLDAALLLMAPRVAGDGQGVGLGRRPTMVRFRAQDRRLFVGALHRKWFARLCEIIGAPELLDDPRFASQREQAVHADELIAAIEARLATRPAHEWEREFVQAGLPASVVRTLGEVLAEPHVRQRGILRTASLPDGRTATVVGAGFRLEGTGAPEIFAVPRLGQHTDEVLATL